ncbi:hypothetical protein JW887_04125 [Candidatus Dojkabacteria bacterium]|nr:hypothetical protein [Candidatus Dojkabacteria bacterium]
MKYTLKRTNAWLEYQMFEIWENHFADVPRKNLVIIKFGKSSKRQLGSIKWAKDNTGIKSIMKKKSMQALHKIQDDKRITVITITKHFQSLEVPDYVVQSTIAHEMCHYTHGFNSPLNQLYDFPHQGGIIHRELTKRGLGLIHTKAKRWIKTNWVNFIKKNLLY